MQISTANSNFHVFWTGKTDIFGKVVAFEEKKKIYRTVRCANARDVWLNNMFLQIQQEKAYIKQTEQMRNQIKQATEQ